MQHDAAACCPGIPLAADSPLAKLSLLSHHQARLPASYLEALFHGVASIVLVVLGRRRLLAGRRFAFYIGSYAIVRFSLEFVRDVPRPSFGLSYYQLLALVLGGLALHGLFRALPSAAVRATDAPASLA